MVVSAVTASSEALTKPLDMDNVRGGHQRYTSVAIALHWAIALLILFNLSLGFFMEDFKPHLRGIVVPLHISSGLTVLILSVVRVAWRLTHSPPPFVDGLKRWEHTAAHAAHGLIYALMFLMPLTGWSLISAHPARPGGGPKFWGLVSVPQIPPIAHMEVTAQKAAHATFVELHSIGAWIFVGLLLLHVAAALKHQFHDRKPELERMGLGWSRR
jgi:cytochrome b561